MKIETITTTVHKVEANYLGSVMSFELNKKPKTQKEVNDLCRASIKEVRFFSASNEFDVYVPSDTSGYISRHCSVNVDEEAKEKCLTLLLSKECHSKETLNLVLSLLEKNRIV